MIQHYWQQEDAHALTQLNTVQGPSIRLPNNHSLSANVKGQIPLSVLLTKEGKNAMILPG